jgi:hypothetical protein
MTKRGGSDQPPDGIGEDEIGPAEGWRRGASPLALFVFGAVIVLGLTGLLGHERMFVGEANGVQLSVHSPEIIRNGEFFEIKIGVESSERIDQLVIGVDDALWVDMTVNTMIPAATEEEHVAGEFRFSFAELAPNDAFLFKIDLQVNPDILGGNDGTVTVYDGEEELAATDVSITVLP